MNFEDEDYRRQYVRRTVTSKRLGWQGRAVRNEMLTEFDRAGVWEFTEDAAQDIADLVELPLEVVQVGLTRLLATKTWVMTEREIVWPRFVPAQTCPRSDRIRQQELRERRRDEALSNAKAAKSTSPVTNGHEPSRESQTVTPNRAEQSLTEPNRAEREDARAPEVPGLVVVAPGPIKASRRETAETALLGARGVARYEYTPGWKPTKAVNLARALELGLTEQDLWERWDQVQDKHYSQAFRSDEKQFNRELAWLVADKRKASFQSQSKRDREAFELPGRERAASR